MADLFKILLAGKLGHCDSLYESVIGKKLGGYSWQSDYETTPYLYRAMPNLSHYYNREIMEEVVGGSVGWNQLIVGLASPGESQGITYAWNDGKCTVSGVATSNCNLAITSPYPQYILGHKYYISGCPSGGSNQSYSLRYNANGYGENGNGAVLNCTNGNANMEIKVGTNYPIISIASGTNISTPKVFAPQLTDLTLALGSTIADYVYSLEQATAGSGVAWLKANFPKMFGQYNPYDAGSIQSVSGLVSHDMTGFNQWDEEWEVGMYESSVSTVVKITDTTHIRSKNPIPVIPNKTYYFDSASKSVHLIVADSEGNVLYRTTSLNNGTFTTPTNGVFVYFNMAQAYGTTYKNDICINLSDASRNGQYEPYRKSSYPLDSTLTLRGIPKLDNGKLYYDGDTYGADGSVSRKYGVVDLGTLEWTYASGVERFVSEKFDSAKAPETNFVSANIVCDKYVTTASANTEVSSYDKHIGITRYNNIAVRDTAYNDATAFKTAMSGVYLVYELATPTTETAQPFTKTQLCDSGGTEELVTSGIVSVGHKSKYAEK